MPWTTRNYPNSMKFLSATVRRKAIEIANALLEEKSMQEGVVIATAISRAKDWAANRGIEAKADVRSKTTDVKEHGADRYVIPHGDEWAVKKEGSKRVEKVVPARQEAIKLAKREAKASKASVTIQGRRGKLKKRISYTPHKKKKSRAHHE
jgi:uncharacterized protein YdaT